MQNITKRIIVWTVVGVLILLLPLAMLFTNEVQWNETFAYCIMLLAIGGIYELWRWLKTKSMKYHFAFDVGLFGMIFLGWVSGAIGIIGSENNPLNLMYWAVPIVGFIGSVISQLKSRGMTRTLFTVAIVQFLVPVIALIISPEVSFGNAGVMGVVAVNFIFVILFATSALLFRRSISNTTNP